MPALRAVGVAGTVSLFVVSAAAHGDAKGEDDRQGRNGQDGEADEEETPWRYGESEQEDAVE